MCLRQLQPANRSRPVLAHKLFFVDEQERLHSAFHPAGSYGAYPANRDLAVLPERSTFYAFQNREDAVEVAGDGEEYWNLRGGDLVVLPVVLDQVVYIGNMDNATLWRFYPAWAARRILVLDTAGNRLQFYRQLRQWWRDHPERDGNYSSLRLRSQVERSLALGRPATARDHRLGWG